MQKLTIAEIKPSTGEKSPTIITDTTGAKMSGFDNSLKSLNPGDVIEAELEVKGKYTNIKSFNLVQKSVTVKEPATKGYAGKSTETVQMEITAGFRKAALEQAVGLISSSPTTLNTNPNPAIVKAILQYADEFYAWLMADTKPSPQPPQSTGKPPEKPASISAQKTADSKPPVKGDDYLAWLKGGISAAGTTNTEVMAWIKENLKIEKPTITDAVLKMTPEQKEKLKKHINDLVVEKEKLF